MLVALVDISARPRSWLISVCALAILLLALSEPALAQLPFGCTGATTVVCDATGNTYPAGINLSGSTSDELNLILKSPGVEVIIPTPGISIGANAVNLANTTASAAGASATLTANDATVENDNNPNTNNNTGLRIQSAGNAIITSSGKIDVAGGTSSDWDILDFAQGSLVPANAIVKYGALDASGNVVGAGSGLTLGNSAIHGGLESGGVQADNRGTGNATIDAWGDVTVFAGTGYSGIYGLIAHAGDSFPSGIVGNGDAIVRYRGGTISVSGDTPRGILTWVDGEGSSTAITDPGTTIIVSGPNQGGPGVYVYAGSASASAGSKVIATVASTITSSGPTTADPSSRPWGIRALSGADAPIVVTYTGLGITTQGSNGVGIGAISDSGAITIDSSGPVSTNGSGAHGVFAQSGSTTRITIGPGGPIDT